MRPLCVSVAHLSNELIMAPARTCRWQAEHLRKWHPLDHARVEPAQTLGNIQSSPREYTYIRNI